MNPTNSRRAWDGHCPECYSDTRRTEHVSADRVVVRCLDCGHCWNENPPSPPQPTLFRGSYVNPAAIAPPSSLEEAAARLRAGNDALAESLKRESTRSLVARLDRENQRAEERRDRRGMFEVFQGGKFCTCSTPAGVNGYHGRACPMFRSERP